jgi:hypothetical protein
MAAAASTLIPVPGTPAGILSFVSLPSELGDVLRM